MIRRDVREAIVDLTARGMSKSAVARALGVSRPTVRRVVASDADRKAKAADLAA